MLLRTTLRRLAPFALCALYALFCSVPTSPGEAALPKKSEEPGPPPTVLLDRLTVPFVANAGQESPAVAYYARTPAGTVFVTRKSEIVYALAGRGRSGSGRNEGWSVTETPAGGSIAFPAWDLPATTRVSEFMGSDPSRWKSDLATYDVVGLGEPWPGIALSLRARGRSVEKIFRLAPGADPSRIRMRIAGARAVRVDGSGGLTLATGIGDVRLSPPVAFQETAAGRRAVRVAYQHRAGGYGFRVGRYDARLPLVIDPILQATYLGGSGNDGSVGIAIHPVSGQVYVAGATTSSDFPGTAGGAQSARAAGSVQSAFVARLNASLTTLIQATYLGGNGTDSALAIAIHPTSGDVYVSGETTSSNFPGTAGGAQTALNGSSDAYIARLDATLTTLVQATYLGGGGTENAALIAVHPASGDVYVEGRTSSSDFPATAGGAQPETKGDKDIYVARLSPSLTTLRQATYLGGTLEEQEGTLAIDPTSGDIYAAGWTKSTDFPGTTGGAQPANAGGQDGFVARLNASLTSLLQATYLGGAGNDAAVGIQIHPSSGEVYVAGWTKSSNFPGTAGGAQPAFGGIEDGFVARLSSTLTSLSQATYLGGADSDLAFIPVIDAKTGDVFVAGDTVSTDFPGTAGGAQPANAGGAHDAFLARLSASLTTLKGSTYVGGSGDELGQFVTLDPASEDVYVVGVTTSTDFPCTSGGAQAAFGGGGFDAYIVRLSPDLSSAKVLPAALVVDPSAGALSNGNGVFEPGETAAVQPAWKNGCVPRSLTGSASSFTGPAGPAYTIPDAAASYGTIPGGTTASCAGTANCYALSLSVPPIRPATHWDATFVETPSTGDPPKTWTLHIGESFTDVPTSELFYKKIETIFHAGITAGCTATTYCPGDKVPRSQMALFIARGIAHGAPLPVSGSVNGKPYNCTSGGTSLFTDVAPTDIDCKAVHDIDAQNVTSGCAASLYCPNDLVTRAQMGIFIAKAIVAPAGGSAVPLSYGPDPVTGLSYSCDPASPNLHFTDVSVSDVFCRHVHFLWAKGVIAGCSADLYCPNGDVGRDEMAKFLANAFQLQLYGP